VTFGSCIVWGNIGGAIVKDETSDPIVSFSCIEGGWQGDGNIDKDPSLVQPGHFEDADGDGNVDTWFPGDYHLQPGSPCTDTSTCAGAPPFDIEGNARPDGAGCDIGAYEYVHSQTLPRFRRGDSNDDGDVNIADAVHVLNWLFGGGLAPGCRAAANSNGDEAVNIADPTYLLNHLFSGESPPLEPFPNCGTSDLEADRRLDCEAPPQQCL
jgi:hypothetical protein